MFEPYTIFLKQAVHNSLRDLRRDRKQAIEKFIDDLSENPFDEGDFSETDREGRVVYCKIVKDIAVTFYPDHPVKEIKILEIVRTP